MENTRKVLVIIPAYNEQDNILSVYRAVKKNDVNVVVINDGSTDDTEKILSDNDIPHIRLIENLGIGGAVQTGYKYAALKGYEVAVQLDGDGQHRAEDLDRIVAPVLAGEVDMVIGSRFVSQKKEGFRSSLMRRAGIKTISSAIKLKTGKCIYDTTSGYRAINRKLIECFAKEYSPEYPEPISIVAALLKGGRVKEVPVKMAPRGGGKSSITMHKSMYYMINVVLQIMMQEKY